MEDVKRFLTEHNYDFSENESLKKHSYIKVGGIAAFVFTPRKQDELFNTIAFLKSRKVPYKVIGNGSNILFSDKYFPGVIIKNKLAFSDIIILEDEVIVGSSVMMVKLSLDLAKRGYVGLEFMSGIPGTIGGGLYMNAGAYNKEMKDVVKEVIYLDAAGKVKTLTLNECEFGYRTSIFKEKLTDCLIIGAKITLERGSSEESLALIQKRKERRLSTQPLNYPSCGSVFKNPSGTHAYLFIDEVGLRGYRIGGAKFSELHCNFIINDNNATATDIRKLIEIAEKLVYEKFQVNLVREVEYFNW